MLLSRYEEDFKRIVLTALHRMLIIYGYFFTEEWSKEKYKIMRAVKL